MPTDNLLLTIPEALSDTALLERLAASGYSVTPGGREVLAIIYADTQGGALHRAANPGQAAADNTQALQLLEQLADGHPERLDYQAELALCQSNQGVLLAEIGSTTDAALAQESDIASAQRPSPGVGR